MGDTAPGVSSLLMISPIVIHVVADFYLYYSVIIAIQFVLLLVLGDVVTINSVSVRT